MSDDLKRRKKIFELIFTIGEKLLTMDINTVCVGNIMDQLQKGTIFVNFVDFVVFVIFR